MMATVIAPVDQNNFQQENSWNSKSGSTSWLRAEEVVLFEAYAVLVVRERRPRGVTGEGVLAALDALFMQLLQRAMHAIGWWHKALSNGYVR